jgi:hypothetical protein
VVIAGQTAPVSPGSGTSTERPARSIAFRLEAGGPQSNAGDAAGSATKSATLPISPGRVRVG